MLRCFQRCLHRSCGHCAWGCRRRVFLHGHCDGIPVASDLRWAVTSFLFISLLFSVAELLSFPRRVPVSTGNTQYKVSNPPGRCAFDTSLGQSAPPLDSLRPRKAKLSEATLGKCKHLLSLVGLWPPSLQGLPLHLRRLCRPAPGPKGFGPLDSRPQEKAVLIS